MQDDLAPLLKLQEHDISVDELKEKLAALDPLIQEKNRRIEKLKSDLKTAKENLSTHQVKKKQLEMDADQQEKLVQKHQSELNSLKSNDAYKAMLGEIQAAKDAVVKIEDQILALMEDVERDERNFKEIEKKFKSDEGVVKSEIQALESQKSALSEQVKKKWDERQAFAATVAPALLSQYETIREKRGDMAIVPMVNNSCGGCRMTLTPNIANEVKKGKHMVLCESCSRILYLPAAPAAQATPAETTPVAASSSPEKHA